MQSIIGKSPSLPRCRTSATSARSLRIVLAVNALAAVAALVREPIPALWAGQWLEMMAVVEPHLIVELAVLYAIAPWLARQSDVTGVVLVGGVTIGVGVGVQALFARDLPQSPYALWRHVAFALLVFGALLGYFALRAKALSPAIAESRLQALQARIRPHFLFNSINAVLSLVRNDPKQAELALLDMADLFRAPTRATGSRAAHRRNRSLPAISRAQEAAPHRPASGRLAFEQHAERRAVPPLLLQPLLENAVYHGIEPSSTPRHLDQHLLPRRRGSCDPAQSVSVRR